MIRETEAGPYAGRITADCHIHTEFSADSETKITDQVERAIELGTSRNIRNPSTRKTSCFLRSRDFLFSWIICFTCALLLLVIIVYPFLYFL